MWINASDFLGDPGRTALSTVHADVFVFDQAISTLTISKSGAVSIYARVLAADGPITLAVAPISPEIVALQIWASEVDQHITLVIDRQKYPLQLGDRNLGVIVSITDKKPKFDYKTKYSVLTGQEALNAAATELRLASILFWLDTENAKSITQHAARVTTNSSTAALLNLQANSLYQQLCVSTLSGPRSSYAPVLKLASYRQQLHDAIAVAEAFETQYDRFMDKEDVLDTQIQALDEVIASNQATVDLQQTLVKEADNRWTEAVAAADKASADFQASQDILKEKAAIFEVELKMWIEHQIIKAVFDVVMGIVEIAAAIGLSLVMPAAAAGAPAEAGAAVDAIGKLAKGIELTEGEFESLKGAVEAIQSCIESSLKSLTATLTIVDLAKNQSPGTPVNPDETPGNTDVDMLISLAAWDLWREEIDQQMATVVAEEVPTADDYQLALRKHAIGGKLVSQLRNEACRAGVEYGHALLSLNKAEDDIKRLKDLRDSYQGKEDEANQAKVFFYDRMSMIRTTILIEMRKATWAYQYLALAKSSVFLDPTKSIAELNQDTSMLGLEVENWAENYESDPLQYNPSPVLGSQVCFLGLLKMATNNETYSCWEQSCQT